MGLLTSVNDGLPSTSLCWVLAGLSTSSLVYDNDNDRADRLDKDLMMAANMRELRERNAALPPRPLSSHHSIKLPISHSKGKTAESSRQAPTSGVGSVVGGAQGHVVIMLVTQQVGTIHGQC
jgi:hypothetical protein